MSESKCKACGNTLLKEIPGVFYDFDADPAQGSEGIPLCTECLGTGIVPENNLKFSELCQKAKALRRNRFSLQIAAAKHELPPKQLRSELTKIDKQLIDLARKALNIVNEPVSGCYAKQIIK
jgi:hypothetical protein